MNLSADLEQLQLKYAEEVAAATTTVSLSGDDAGDSASAASEASSWKVSTTTVRQLRQDVESGRETIARLEADLEAQKKTMEKEQEQKMQLVLLLMADRKKIASVYLEEKRRSDELARALREERNKVKVRRKEPIKRILTDACMNHEQ